MRHQNLPLQRVSGKKRAELSIPGMGEQRRRRFNSGQGCRQQGHSIKGGRAVTLREAAGAESQGQAVPALPILVTAAMGKITALAAVIAYKGGDKWSYDNRDHR